MNTHWNGKKVAFLGDSITDKCHVGTAKNYWQFLQERLGIEPLVYGINGARWIHLPEQAKLLKTEHGDDIDAIFIFMGTNDFNGGIPLGNWWDIREEEINSHGKMMKKPRRIFNTAEDTFRSTINAGMMYLKENFPKQQIILMTPIHRGYAEFGGDNVQPDESYPNDIGLYVEEYIHAIREAADIWSVPLIDLFRLSGLYPVFDAYTPYFSNAETDRLHPAAAGHERLAKTIMHQMLALPSDFR